MIVAGENFGIGSSREQAAGALIQLGVAAVIAPSFGGLFFRNAFNLGLLLLTCNEAQSMDEGEHWQISFDPESGPTRLQGPDGRVLQCAPIPGFLYDMVRAGGLLQLLKQRYTRPSHA